MKTLRLGEITVEPIVEQPDIPVKLKWLLANASDERLLEHRDWLHPSTVDWATGRIRMTFMSFLVRTPKRTILVDTCCGNGRRRGGNPLFEMLDTDYLGNLRRAGVDPAEIDTVMCTHLHVDHVGWNTRQQDGRWVPTFPNARYLFSQKEVDWWAQADARQQGSVASRAAYHDSVVPIIEANLADLVTEDRVVVDDPSCLIQLHSLPGHSAGHMGMRLSSGPASALMTGDALHHPVQIAEPHWSNPADLDPALALATKQGLIDTYADQDALILAAHFTGPTAGRIVSSPKGARFKFLDD